MKISKENILLMIDLFEDMKIYVKTDYSPFLCVYLNKVHSWSQGRMQDIPAELEAICIDYLFEIAKTIKGNWITRTKDGGWFAIPGIESRLKLLNTAIKQLTETLES